MLTSANRLASPGARRATQKVVVVNGSRETLALVESVLDAGQYDVVFAADLAHAYSEIKKNRPDLVILCLNLDDLVGFQVLSMLNLDDDTRRIPLLTYTSDPVPPVTDGEAADDDGTEFELSSPQTELTRN
jgi:PleD family two-component response regulator